MVGPQSCKRTGGVWVTFVVFVETQTGIRRTPRGQHRIILFLLWKIGRKALTREINFVYKRIISAVKTAVFVSGRM
jgi:hypothetical protein